MPPSLPENHAPAGRPGVIPFPTRPEIPVGLARWTVQQDWPTYPVLIRVAGGSDASFRLGQPGPGLAAAVDTQSSPSV